MASNAGYRCERCDDGYYDDRAALAADAAAADADDQHDDMRHCVRCRCNNNIDSNAVANCDRYTAATVSFSPA